MSKKTKRIRDLMDKDGNLPANAWPGMYPLFYVTARSDILCSECATDALKDEEEYYEDLPTGHNGHNKPSGYEVPTGYDVNWENTKMHCEECDKQIESAYGEDDEESTKIQEKTES